MITITLEGISEKGKFMKIKRTGLCITKRGYVKLNCLIVTGEPGKLRVRCCQMWIFFKIRYLKKDMIKYIITNRYNNGNCKSNKQNICHALPFLVTYSDFRFSKPFLYYSGFFALSIFNLLNYATAFLLQHLYLEEITCKKNLRDCPIKNLKKIYRMDI